MGQKGTEGQPHATPEQHLARDLKLKRLMGAVSESGTPAPRLEQSAYDSHFQSLAHSIVAQQVSTKAASAIFARLQEGLGGAVEPDSLRDCAPEALRSFGLSGSKARYMKGLADAVQEGRLDLNALDQLEDEHVVRELTTLPGIGLWTAQMFLIFRLCRPDVLPAGDLAVRKGFALMMGQNPMPTQAQVLKRGERWKPWRSIASLYLWRANSLPSPLS